MSPDKNNLNAETAPQEGVLARLGDAFGVKKAAAILALSGGIAEEALAVSEIQDPRISAVVNDGNGVVLLGTDNDCGDFAFLRFTGENYETKDWYILNAGATDPVWVPGHYDHLEATSNCDFVGPDFDNGILWRIDSSTGDWSVASPVLDGINYDLNAGLDPIRGHVAWDLEQDRLKATTNWSALNIVDFNGLVIVDDGVFNQSDPDWDSSWHGRDTAMGRYFFDEDVHEADPTWVVYKNADDLSGPSIPVAEGFGGALSADGSKLYMAAYDTSRGLYRLHEHALAKGTYYCDSDGDGHGDPAHPFIDDAGKGSFTYQGIAYVPNADDCNDGDVHLNIAPRDCNEPTDDTDTTDTQDTTETPPDTDDTQDTVDAPETDTPDTPDGQKPDTDTPEDEEGGCNNAPLNVNTGWLLAGVAMVAARRRRQSEGENAQ